MSEYQLPHGYSTRPATTGDALAIARLMNLDEIALEGKAEYTEERAKTSLSAPGLDLEQDSLLIFTSEGALVGIGMLFHFQPIRQDIRINVSPVYREKGLDDYLLARLEERARTLTTWVESDLRVVLAAGTDVRSQANIRLFERHGLQRIRQTWRMAIELNGEPVEAILPEGVRMETFQPGMERIVFDAEMDFFQDHWGFLPRDYQEWLHFNVGYKGFDPTLCFLAMVGDEVVAMALCRREAEDVGYVSTLGVRRDWRRHGLGMAILRHAFGVFYHRDVHNVHLHVDAQSLTGATRLYERAGMHVAQQAVDYEKELRAGKELRIQTLAV
ncbi:GNAT family N-acetyltransferase [Ktedonospora formicarum]|uniref:Putative acetyltransferase, GNAT n=1 Tax=Ktedonospora formicarum TaxID=2778364 RepID=A0A8J3HYR2_9CHLR|nr:GNAT family N-acetyltransferase [Ktedonospora formicarum]GHO42978.1 putative acetyltransferase, GNAT [Ktedonospora formicarum]